MTHYLALSSVGAARHLAKGGLYMETEVSRVTWLKEGDN